MKVKNDKSGCDYLSRWGKYSAEDRLNWLGSAWEFVQALKSAKKSKFSKYVKN